MKKKEETVHDKTPVLTDTETYVLLHNIFITYLVLIFTDLNKAKIFKIPYKDSPNYGIEIVMSFSYLNLLKAKEHTKVYHIRKTKRWKSSIRNWR